MVGEHLGGKSSTGAGRGGHGDERSALDAPRASGGAPRGGNRGRRRSCARPGEGQETGGAGRREAQAHAEQVVGPTAAASAAAARWWVGGGLGLHGGCGHRNGARRSREGGERGGDGEGGLVAAGARVAELAGWADPWGGAPGRDSPSDPLLSVPENIIHTT